MSLPPRQAAPPAPEGPGALHALQAELATLLEQRSPDLLARAQDYLALTELLGDRAGEAGAHLLLAQALMAAEPHAALVAAGRAARAFAALDVPVQHAEALTLSGRLHLNQGAFEAAEGDLRAALLLVQPLDTPDAQTLSATALNALAGAQFNRGEAREALLSLETALRVWTRLGHLPGQASCLTNIGSLQTTFGEFHAAIETLGRAYRLYQSGLQDAHAEGCILNSLASAHAANQDHALAVEVATSALTAARESGDTLLLTTTHLNLGTFSLQAGQFTAAAEQLGQALQLSREAGYRTTELSTLDSLGLLHQRTGRPRDALGAHISALELALELQDTQGELEARLHLGRVQKTLGEVSAAREQVGEALGLALDCQNRSAEAEAQQLLAELAQQEGDYRQAYEHLQAHLSVKDELFNVERDRQTRNLSVRFEVERARHDADVYRVRTELAQEGLHAAEAQVQQRTAELARAQHEVVTRLAMAAEYRDDTTGEHTRRVGRAAARIARALGWTAERARLLGVAARLHDVGKIGIPDAILLKRGQLSAQEFDQMKTHTLIGARILSGGRSELLQLAEEIALTHHERWDGSGYPIGLSGTQIPLTGRIVALADVFDALTQARPYKRAWTREEALQEVRRSAGTHFDPLIVETALQVLGSDHDPDGEDDADGTDGSDADVLSVFEQLLLARTQDLGSARQAAEAAASEPERMAVQDTLTGLPNRRAFVEALEGLLTPVLSGPGPVSARAAVTVLTLHCDFTPPGQDHHPEDAMSDEALLTFASRLQEAFLPLGRTYRLDAQVLAVLAPHLTEAQASDLVCRALQGTAAPGACIPRVSSGLACSPADASTPEELMRVSERRMDHQRLSRQLAHRTEP